MRTLQWWPFSSPRGKDLPGTRRNIVPFLVLSLLIHLMSLGLADWAITRVPSLTKEEKVLAKKLLKKKLQEKKKEKEKLVYVKILEIPKPKVQEKPKKSHIIAQYNMTKKGPKGKRERSSLSGESSTLNFKPGLPITPPKPRITLVPGQKPVALPKMEAKKGKSKAGKAKPRPKLAEKGEEKMPPPAKAKGEKKGTLKEGERKQKEARKRAREEKAQKLRKAQKGERKKLVQVVPETGPQTKIIPPLPKRQIPLFDPSLINEQSHKIVPQMGEGQSQEISLDTTKSKYISYFKHIKDKLYLVWRYPLGARANAIQGTVRILFVINRQGELTEVKILQSSGFSILDREAQRALRAAAPFGPFPPDWTERELRIRARFIYRLFSSPFH